MPLITIENLNKDACWGLWEITESKEELEALLNNREDKQKLRTIRSEEKVMEKLAARLILKEILRFWGITYAGTEGEETGKPFLNKIPFNISLSHSHKAAVAIIHKKHEIGIDIELIQDKIGRIANRVFNESEMKAKMGDFEYLTILWTFKEVLYKIYGSRGLDFKKNIEITIADNRDNYGTGKGAIRTENQELFFPLKYQKFRNYIISFNTDV
jgi:phosphopantetheinyl transferase